jgi:murein DD-endopeptidase MepM/ murein hydrolase activator NlpD
VYLIGGRELIKEHLKRAGIVWLLLLIAAGGTAPSSAQTPQWTVLVVWNDALSGYGLDGTIWPVPSYQRGQPLPPDGVGNVLHWADANLPPLPDGFGFVQGVRAADGTLAYGIVAQDSPAYQVWQASTQGPPMLLFSGEVNAERGYLIPLGWSNDGRLWLLERDHLRTLGQSARASLVRLWRYAADGTLSLQLEVPLPMLKGNSVALPDGGALLGFDTVGGLGYRVDLNSGQLSSFPSLLLLEDPPRSVFETYPLQVAGVTTRQQLEAWATQPPAAVPLPLAVPFLHWPLPDYARSITCYPDSSWTELQYPLECPGLATPRAYVGHEGTDVGGRPNGLPLATPVYAMATGLVLARQTDCIADDITCGDAYGNYVLLQHVRVLNGQATLWYSGYAHLQSVLVTPRQFVAQIGLPIALSGMSGFGGPHLHIEVRAPDQATLANWLDPWDQRLTDSGTGLWLGEVGRPIAAVVAAPPPSLRVCRSTADNNLRSGPGTEFDVVGKTQADQLYAVFQTQVTTSGTTPGEWANVRWGEADNALEGWIWSALLSDCTAP